MTLLIRSLIMRQSWWVTLVLCYGLVIGASLSFSIANIRNHSLVVATEGARNVFHTVVLTREWNSRHGTVYVPAGELAPPNPYLEHPRRDVTTTDGQKLTLINPAYMTRQISEISERSQGLSFRITSLNPLRPANAPDAWEKEALQSLAAGNDEVKGVVTRSDGQHIFRFMAPLLVTEDCLQCHVEQGYRVGDVRGGISISQPYEPFLAAALPSEWLTVGGHLMVFALLTGLSWWWLTHLRKSWLELEDKIAELGQARQGLLQNEKMASLGRMVACFAHELNTPVGIAVGAISHGDEVLNEIDGLLRQEEVHEDDLRNRLETLRQSGGLALANLRRAATLVQRFKRTSIDQTSEQHRRFNLRELIDDLMASLKSQMKNSPVQVAVDCPADLVIDGVPGLLEQLLTNLVMNSLQHGFEEGTRPGTIRIVCVRPAAGRLLLVYSDDGAGMAADVAERIFEPFFTTRRGQGGSGLGMYLCYNIVIEQLGGSIACASAPGAGVRFTIDLPFPEATDGHKEKPA